MIRGIVGSSLKFRFLVIAVTAALMVAGIIQLRAMPVDVLPEFSPPYVEIQTEALGLSAEEVEQLITVPLEQDMLNGVAWLDVIRSESVPGLSNILIFFQPGTDLYRARQMVQERLARAYALPRVSRPPTMIQPLSSTSRFMIVGLSSKNLSLIELSVLARWNIGPRLMGVPGVAKVAIWGQRERQLQVQVDPERLRAQGVSLDQVLATTGNALWVSSLSYLQASTPGTGGFIDTPNQRIGIWHVLPISSPDDLAQVPVEGSTTMRLGGAATVIEDHQPLIGDAIINDSPSLLLVVEKFPGTSTLDVTHGVEAAIDALRQGLGGVDLDTTLFRSASFIETMVTNLGNSLLLSAILAIIVLGLLLFSWRVALISFVAIFVSLMAALLVLYNQGATLNVMVLAGLAIAIGAIVDDSIIDVTSIAHRLRQRRKEESESSTHTITSTLDIILESSVEIRNTIIFATLISLIAILPLFFLEGVSGAFFQPLAVSYVIALLVSMVVALTVTPALSLILLSGMPLEGRGSPLMAWLQGRYASVLARIVGTPRTVYAMIGLLLVIGLATLPFLGQQSLLPTFKEQSLMIQWDGAPGTSRQEMDRILARVSRELRTIPGVVNVGAHVGRAVMGDQAVGINSSQLWVSIDPKANYEATVAAVQETVDGYPGMDRNVGTYLKQTLGQALAVTNDSIVVRVFGENLDVLRTKAEEVRNAVAGINGITDLRVDLPVMEPILEIKVDLTAGQRFGLNPGDVRRAIATLISGLQVGSLFENQKVFEVVVWGAPETRQSVPGIRELLIDTPNGGHVRLADLADVRVSSTPRVIKREGASTYLDVGFAVNSRDLGAVASDVKVALQRVEFPLEYHAEILGEYVERQTALQRIIIAILVAVIGIYLLLQAALRSWRIAALSLLSLPLALVGGVVAVLLATGGVISIGSVIGLVTVLAISIRQSILLIRHYRNLEQQEGVSFGTELIMRGAQDRVTPIVMTALTAGLGLMSFVIFGNIPGHEIVYPMAIAILGGLITSTLLNLFVIPFLYLRFGRPSSAPMAAGAATE